MSRELTASEKAEVSSCDTEIPVGADMVVVGMERLQRAAR